MICLFVLEFMTRFGRRSTDAIGHPGVETFAVMIDCPVPSRMAGKFGQQTSMRLIGHLSLDSRDADHAEKFRSEEHTSELQSLMRISYAVFCLKKKKHIQPTDYLETNNTPNYDTK